MTFALDIFAPTAPAPAGGSVRAESQDAAPTDTAFADKVADATAARRNAPAPAPETKAHAVKGHLLAPAAGTDAATGDETIAPAEMDGATPDVPLVVAPEAVEAETESSAPAEAAVDPQSAPVIPPPLSPIVPSAPIETVEAAAPTPAVVTPETPADALDQGAGAPQILAAVEPDMPAAPTPPAVGAAPRSEAAPVKASVDVVAEQPTTPGANDKAATDKAAAETLKAAAAPAPATPVAAQIATQIAALARPTPKAVAAPVGDSAPAVEEPATPVQAAAPEAARTVETPRPAVNPALPSTPPPVPDTGHHAVSNAAASDSAAEAAPAAPDQNASGGKVDAAGNTPVPPPAPSATPSTGDAVVVAATVTPEAAVEVAVEAPRAAVTTSTEAARNLSLSQLSHATIETTAQIAAQIVRRLEGRSTRFDMVLTPEDLGRVEVRLEIDTDGQLAARLAFDNPAAATDLRGRADELRRQLQDAGFQLSDNALEFSQRDTSSGGGSDRHQDRNALFAGGSRLAAQADAAAAPAAWINLALTPDRVDMKV